MFASHFLTENNQIWGYYTNFDGKLLNYWCSDTLLSVFLNMYVYTTYRGVTQPENVGGHGDPSISYFLAKSGGGGIWDFLEKWRAV